MRSPECPGQGSNLHSVYGGGGNYYRVKEETGWTDEQIKDAFEAGEIDIEPRR